MLIFHEKTRVIENNGTPPPDENIGVARHRRRANFGQTPPPAQKKIGARV